MLLKQCESGEVIIGDSHVDYPLSETASPDYNPSLLINQLILKETRRFVAIEENSVARTWLGWYVKHASDAFIKTPQAGLHVVTGMGGKGMTVGPAVMDAVVSAIIREGKLDYIRTGHSAN